jgi:hypothetical protein
MVARPAIEVSDRPFPPTKPPAQALFRRPSPMLQSDRRLRPHPLPTPARRRVPFPELSLPAPRHPRHSQLLQKPLRPHTAPAAARPRTQAPPTGAFLHTLSSSRT